MRLHYKRRDCRLPTIKLPYTTPRIFSLLEAKGGTRLSGSFHKHFHVQVSARNPRPRQPVEGAICCSHSATTIRLRRICGPGEIRFTGCALSPLPTFRTAPGSIWSWPVMATGCSTILSIIAIPSSGCPSIRVPAQLVDSRLSRMERRRSPGVWRSRAARRLRIFDRASPIPSRRQSASGETTASNTGRPGVSAQPTPIPFPHPAPAPVVKRSRRRVVLLALFLALAAGGCWYALDQREISVQVVSPQYADIASTVSSMGTVIPVHDFPARAQFSGMVEKIYVHVGQKVHAGQMLVEPFISFPFHPTILFPRAVTCCTLRTSASSKCAPISTSRTSAAFASESR